MAQKIGGRLCQRYDELARLGEVGFKPLNDLGPGSCQFGAAGSVLKVLVDGVQVRLGRWLSCGDSLRHFRQAHTEDQRSGIGLLRFASPAPLLKRDSSRAGVNKIGIVEPRDQPTEIIKRIGKALSGDKTGVDEIEAAIVPDKRKRAMRGA